MSVKTEKQLSATKAWKEANRERVRSYQQEWRERNKAHVSDYNKAYQADYRVREDVQFKSWMRNLHRNYGITPACFNKLWVAQGGKCAICEVNLKPRGRMADAVAVDHNHQTGEVRALLCRKCNHGLGHFLDSPELLQMAAEYLREKGHYSQFKRNLS